MVYEINMSVYPRIGFSPYGIMFIQKPPDLSGVHIMGCIMLGYQTEARSMNIMFQKFCQMEEFILAEQQWQQELQKVEAE